MILSSRSHCLLLNKDLGWPSVTSSGPRNTRNNLARKGSVLPIFNRILPLDHGGEAQCSLLWQPDARRCSTWSKRSCTAWALCDSDTMSLVLCTVDTYLVLIKSKWCLDRWIGTGCKSRNACDSRACVDVRVQQDGRWADLKFSLVLLCFAASFCHCKFNVQNYDGIRLLAWVWCMFNVAIFPLGWLQVFQGWQLDAYDLHLCRACACHFADLKRLELSRFLHCSVSEIGTFCPDWWQHFRPAGGK